MEQIAKSLGVQLKGLIAIDSGIHEDILVYHSGYKEVEHPYYTLHVNKKLKYTTDELDALIRYLTKFSPLTYLKLIKQISEWFSPITFKV